MFNLFNRPAHEADARAYCHSIGADPDERVKGWLKETGGWGPPRLQITRPRWEWYVSANPAIDRTPSSR